MVDTKLLTKFAKSISCSKSSSRNLGMVLTWTIMDWTQLSGWPNRIWRVCITRSMLSGTTSIDFTLSKAFPFKALCRRVMFSWLEKPHSAVEAVNIRLTIGHVVGSPLKAGRSFVADCLAIILRRSLSEVFWWAGVVALGGVNSSNNTLASCDTADATAVCMLSPDVACVRRLAGPSVLAGRFGVHRHGTLLPRSWTKVDRMWGCQHRPHHVAHFALWSAARAFPGWKVPCPPA